MYSNKIKRDLLYLDKLAKFISENYGFDIQQIIEASRGYYGETWKIAASDGFYFVKLSYYETHKEIYRDSFAVIDYITSQGIEFISEIVKTADNR